MVKTFGLVEPLRRALAPLEPGVLSAFVYGSVAGGTDTARSDIDLMIVSDEVTYPDVIDATLGVEQELGRPVNPVILSSEEWRRKGKEDGFVSRVKDRPRLLIALAREMRAAEARGEEDDETIGEIADVMCSGVPLVQPRSRCIAPLRRVASRLADGELRARGLRATATSGSGSFRV